MASCRAAMFPSALSSDEEVARVQFAGMEPHLRRWFSLALEGRVPDPERAVEEALARFWSERTLYGADDETRLWEIVRLLRVSRRLERPWSGWFLSRRRPDGGKIPYFAPIWPRIFPGAVRVLGGRESLFPEDGRKPTREDLWLSILQLCEPIGTEYPPVRAAELGLMRGLAAIGSPLSYEALSDLKVNVWTFGRDLETIPNLSVGMEHDTTTGTVALWAERDGRRLVVRYREQNAARRVERAGGRRPRIGPWSEWQPGYDYDDIWWLRTGRSKYRPLVERLFYRGDSPEGKEIGR